MHRCVKEHEPGDYARRHYGMICVIRITGDVKLSRDVSETFKRLKLRRKYSCIIMKESGENLGMLEKVKNFIAFGEINDSALEKLIEARGKLIDKTKTIDSKKVAEAFKKGKKFEELNIKPFFRLHPPRGGIDSKMHFGKKKGVLGNQKDKINELLERML